MIATLHITDGLIAAGGHAQNADTFVRANSPLDALASVALAARSIENATHDLVKELRREGTSWEQIGSALGVTKQAAHARFGRYTS